MAQTQENKKAKKPSQTTQKPKKAPQKSKTAHGEKPHHSKKTVAKKGALAPVELPFEHKKKTAKKEGGAPKSKLRIIPLGGLQEIGKNMTVLEYGQDIIVIDCGVAFPDDDLLGVDLVIPDTSYLEQNEHRIRGIFLTHGHEDHIGSLPYVLQKLRVPVYGTSMTMGIVRYKLEEAELTYAPKLRVVNAGDTITAGVFKVEFIHVNHSIADACAFAIKTPVGTVFHTGDFKLDVSPLDGQMMDLARIGEIGKQGVLLLMAESTNAERGGFTPSERSVAESFDHIFLSNRDKRIFVATFSSNVHRVQQIINASVKYGRKVAILGRSMVNVIGAAMELGYMELPEGTLIRPDEIRRFRPEQLTLITTGSQGEPMSALYRIAFGEHDRVKLSSQDLVVLSASAIPGNEKLVDKIINAFVRAGIRVYHDRSADVHVSGHACAEELKLMHALLKPKFFMPIHGESRHLYAHKEIAEFMGTPADRIFMPELGRVLELDRDSARWNGSVQSGRVLIDGTGIDGVGNTVLRDRRQLAEAGLIVAMVAINVTDRTLESGPELISKGFVYVKECEDLMEEARQKLGASVIKFLKKNTPKLDRGQLKNLLKDELSRFFVTKNKRHPVILPVVLEL